MSQQTSILLMALELSKKKWVICFSDGSRMRQVSIEAGNQSQLLTQISKAKEHFSLPETMSVTSCYEAGRDGFWIHHMLESHGIKNLILDPASIEVSRRARHRKTDTLDVKRLLKLLIRSVLWGESMVYSVVVVPSEEDEARMRKFREREFLVKECTAHRGRIRSVCALYGINNIKPLTMDVDELRMWNGEPLSPEVASELRNQQVRLKLAHSQIKAIEKEQEEEIGKAANASTAKAKKLMNLKSIGLQSSSILGHEVFGWRTFRNRKAVGAFAGLTGTPYDSGESLKEQGISKAGSKRVRKTMIELAWSWLRYQPESKLTKWFIDRFITNGTKRSKRKGIVALARKLLIALWKYVEQDILPEGALLKV